MNIGELNKYRWSVSKDLIIEKINLKSIIKEEQECRFNVIKEGFNGSDKSEVRFCCSFQEWITKLSKSKLVTVNKVLVSKVASNYGFVLQIDGWMEYKTISIRKVSRPPTKPKNFLRLVQARNRTTTIDSGDSNASNN